MGVVLATCFLCRFDIIISSSFSSSSPSLSSEYDDNGCTRCIIDAVVETRNGVPTDIRDNTRSTRSSICSGNVAENNNVFKLFVVVSSASSSSSFQVLVMPRELSHYNKIQFTGNCSAGSDNFNRELATKQLTPLLSPSKSKKLLVVGTGGKNNNKYLAATSNPNWDIWNLEKFKKYNFGFGYDGKPGQSGNSSKKRSIEDAN